MSVVNYIRREIDLPSAGPRFVDPLLDQLIGSADYPDVLSCEEVFYRQHDPNLDSTICSLHQDRVNELEKEGEIVQFKLDLDDLKALVKYEAERPDGGWPDDFQELVNEYLKLSKAGYHVTYTYVLDY